MGSDAERVVRDLCDAFAKHDAQALRQYFTDDVVYHNVPMDPCIGIDAHHWLHRWLLRHV
jgi:limonene-1,2-epoxide hydrolase